MGIHTVENIACISSMGMKMYPSDLPSRKAVAQRQSVFSRHLLQLSPLGVRLRCGELPHPQPCPSPGTYIWEGSEHVAPSAWCMTTRPVHSTPGLPAGAEAQSGGITCHPPLCPMLGPSFPLHPSHVVTQTRVFRLSFISASASGNPPWDSRLFRDDCCCIICHF